LPPTQPARPHPLTTGPSHLAPRTALWRHAANIFACHSGRASQASPGEGEPESSNQSGLGICAGRGLDTSHMPSVSRFFNPAMGTSNNSTFDTSCSPLRVMRVPGLDPGIDPRNHLLANKMDCRLESGNDDRDLSKYPPAKPGALVLEPLKAACPCRTRQSVPSTLWNAPHLMTC
jgi:hypothetical protein